MSNLIGRAYFVLALGVLCSTPFIIGTQGYLQLNLPEVVYVSAEGDPVKQALFLGIYAIGVVLVIYFSLRHPERIRDTAKVFIETDEPELSGSKS